MRLFKKVVFLSIFILILCFITGCWDNRDIAKLSMITAIGIDQKDDQIEVTVQIIKPEIVNAVKQGSSEQAFTTISATGKTIYEAHRQIYTNISDQPSYAFALLIVINEEVAKKGLNDVLDFYERNPETKRIAIILIAKGISAKEIMQCKSNLENIPAVHLEQTVKNTKNNARIIYVRLFDLMKKISCNESYNVIGVVQSTNKDELNIKNLIVEGGAIFKKDVLVNWLEPEYTEGLSIINGDVTNEVIDINNPLDSSKYVSVEMEKIERKMKVKLENDKPILQFELNVIGKLTGQQGAGDLTTDENIILIKKEVASKLEEKIKSVFSFAQNDIKADILGYAELVHHKNFKYWHEHDNDWHDIFSQSDVEIKIDVQIIRTGLILETTEDEKKR